MVLQEEQRAEIRIHIYSKPTYRETYYEVYDHILNALEEYEGEFNIKLVEEIVNSDFGGFGQILEDEKECQRQVTLKYWRLLLAEMLYTFKFPAIFQNLAVLFFCYLFYDHSIHHYVELKPTQQAVIIILTLPGIIYLIKRFVIDRNRSKVSIKYDFLHQSWLVGIILWSTILALFFSKISQVEISNHQKVFIMMICYFLTNIYIRSLIKLYKRDIKVLAF
ncbi:hypothetical protein ACVWYN_001855 [Pedobacter sp. UYP24]